ncbi:hypothetical protein BM477_00130 [Boudabousia marimammalium]|uniref:HTH cro/C1-type domain-containing protein n=2 Tax=Boudabousia marimammalium TaxID=156892 RepID=A0A1Q5PS62_9ACTO|nr:hypothetical protein BM477_00130 [Boudabousia marimammalium]
MIMADKIIDLRKRNGWTQDGLAARLGVSRQAISKWESAQSVPDLKNILEMAQLFDVSTDYLVRDEMTPEDEGLRAPELSGETAHIKAEDEGAAGADARNVQPLRQVSMEEATQFLTLKQKSSGLIALGVAICIMSVTPLMTLKWLSASSILPLHEHVIEGIAVPVMLLLIAVAVTIFVMQGFKLSKFKYLQDEPFETAYGVTGMVKQRQEEMRSRLLISIIVGIVLCIIAPSVILIGTALLDDAVGIYLELFVTVMFALIAVAIYLFVSVGIPWNATKILLQESDYEPTKRTVAIKISPYVAIYWLLTTALYLSYSLPTNDWGRSWVIWPVAGVLFAVFYIVLERVFRSRIEKQRGSRS